MEYSIIYSDRKSVGLKVKDGKLTVRAPRGTKKEYIEKVIKKHAAWIESAVLRERATRELYSELGEDEIKSLKLAARAYFEEQCAHYASLMGLRYSKITITSAKGRFGSCSSSGHICFSYRLMLYPEAAREYVVVHELAHLREMNHSKRFYRIVERYMPDYKERKKLLKLKG